MWRWALRTTSNVIKLFFLKPTFIPFEQVYLLPDKSKNGKRKTKVKKHTLNPVFDETLKYYMSLNSLESRTLWLTVWHSDMFGRNDFLGEVTINLQGKVFDNPQPQWYSLQERVSIFSRLVFRLVTHFAIHHCVLRRANHSTTYQHTAVTLLSDWNLCRPMRRPHIFHDHQSAVVYENLAASSRRRVHVAHRRRARYTYSSKKRRTWVRSKRMERAMHFAKGNATSPHLVCWALVLTNAALIHFSYLLPDKNRNSKQKTSVAKRTVNPVWNYTFAYDDISLNELSERALELTIWDHDRLASNEFLGGVRFSLGTGMFDTHAQRT